jgi:hypothetical protein
LGYGTVYHHPSVAANILSFHKLVKRFKSVKYDNGIKDAFVVTRDDDSTMEFNRRIVSLRFFIECKKETRI